MDVAIRGDRSCALSLQLAANTWLFAIAEGFGSVDGIPAAESTLTRLRHETERRMRTERFRRAIDRPQVAATALLGVISRVNHDIYMRSAHNDDYVAAGSSFTGALVVHGRAYVIHCGGSAAYLARKGDVRALTGDDRLEEARRALLARALGTTKNLDVSVSSVTVESGDVIVLTGHRVRGDVDRRALIDHVGAGPGEHVVVVRFDDADGESEPGVTHLSVPQRRTFAPLLATLGFLALVIASTISVSSL